MALGSTRSSRSRERRFHLAPKIDKWVSEWMNEWMNEWMA
jgi:hypothetical protein